MCDSSRLIQNSLVEVCRFLIRMVQNNIAITKARTSPNDNSGAVEGTGVGDEFGEAKFANTLKASFGFPLLSKRPKLESGLSV